MAYAGFNRGGCQIRLEVWDPDRGRVASDQNCNILCRIS